jgi:hypothetical protein
MLASLHNREFWKVVFGGGHFKTIELGYMIAKGARGLDKDEYLFSSNSEWHGLKLCGKMK